LPTYSPRTISQDDIQQFRKEGFLLLNDLLTPQEKNELLAWSIEIQQWPETAGKWMQYFENAKAGGAMLCRTENYLDFHAGLKGLICGKITDAISDVMGEPGILFKEKINYKFPGGAGFTPHQDAPAYITFPPRYHVTAMVAVDAMTKQNGCLEVVRGVHTSGLMPHPNGEIDKRITSEYDRLNMWEAVEASAGSVMIFHSYVPHRSGTNNTTLPRRAHYLTFNPLADGDFREAYYIDKRRAFPPEIERIPGVDYSEGAKVYNLSNPISMSG